MTFLTHSLPCALETHKSGVQGAEPPGMSHVGERKKLEMKMKEEGCGIPTVAKRAPKDT